MQIWHSIFSLTPNDVYANYQTLTDYIDKKGITDHLVIILGDLEYQLNHITDCVRQIRLRNNHLIFLDVWGYQFSYQEELQDAAIDRASDNYGVILSSVIGKGIEQESIFRGLEMKAEIGRHRAIYGYFHPTSDNAVNAIERALFSFFGDKV